jgi:hypothetical protein
MICLKSIVNQEQKHIFHLLTFTIDHLWCFFNKLPYNCL